MKVFLLHRDQDFAVKPGLRDTIFGAMASGDLFAITRVRRDLERGRSSVPAAAPPGRGDAMIRRGFWLAAGAATGIYGYRRVSAAGRRLSASLNPAAPAAALPQSAQSAQSARNARSAQLARRGGRGKSARHHTGG